MSNPRHLLLRLATLMLALAAIIAPQNASAKSHQNPETRVRDFSAALPTLVQAKPDVTPDKHYEKLGQLRQLASGPTLVPKGGGSARNVNPKSLGTAGRTQNCGNCAVSMDSTLAGRPATAMPGNVRSAASVARDLGLSPRAWTRASGSGGIEAMMRSAGPGSRGIVFGGRNGANGHFFNVVNQKGTIRFLDGQSGGAATLEGFDSFHLLRTN